MNRVGITKTSEKLFWLSLIIYCLGFMGFYFTTQYTFDRINQEEQSGAFLKFKQSICDGAKTCTDIDYRNGLGTDSPFYKTHIDIIAKQINVNVLQTRYEVFMQQLPWFIRMQFQKELVIDKLNNQPYKGNK